MERYELINSEDTPEYDSYKSIQNITERAFHDFKNIIATISGIAQLTMMKTTSEEVRSNLNCINQATFDLRDTIEKYYDFSKDYTNQNLTPCSITKNINTVLKIVRYKFDIQNMIEKPIKVVLDMENNVYVWSNEYELKQSLLNIIMNAIESMEETGGRLYIKVTSESHLAMIEIRDTGSGISKENLDRLFKETFTTKEKGTGIGLKISKYNIEKVAGSLNIESELGIGTKVTIRLPKLK